MLSSSIRTWCLVFKRHPYSEPYLELLDNEQLIISFMTLAELQLWPLRANWGARRRSIFDRYLDSFSISYCHFALCQVWAQVRNDAYQRGTPIDTADAWIAATALYLQLPLVTHSHQHYARIPGLKLLSRS